MRAIIVGAVESTRVALEAVAGAKGWTVPAVITLPPALAARHSDFIDLAPLAGETGARMIHAANSNAPEVVDAVAAYAPDLVFVIGWSQICGPAFRAAARDRVIGYHPAPLPRLRGRGVLPWTILLDEKITAGSLFWLDDGVDSGPILAQNFFHVAPDETAASLYARHLEILRAMLDECLPALRDGREMRHVQDERFATWAAKRTPADGLIDWNRPASEIARLIRAVGRPYPGAFTQSRDERLVIWKAELWPEGASHAAMPGQVIACGDGGFVVRCGDGGGLRVIAWETPSGRLPRLHGKLGGA
jgi:methionyl-tRNA formyltransferase